jgi:hypothetical protein
MPRYRVIVPVATRLEEIHDIEAATEEEAREIALEEDPEEWVEDTDYYVPLKGSVRVMLHVDNDNSNEE